jgi:hypothetical protein
MEDAMRVIALLAAGLMVAGCAGNPYHVGSTRPASQGTSTSTASVPLPPLSIPGGLFQPAAGSANFDRAGTTVLAHRGDWFFAQTSMECALPIPAGWYTKDTGQETSIFYSESKPSVPLAHKVLSVLIRVHFDGNGDTRTSAQVLASLEQEAAAGGLTLLRKQVVDARRSYAFFSGRSASGKTRDQVIVFSKNRGRGLFYVFSADTYAREWYRYYPLLRAMVNGWVDLEHRPLGMPLPDRITG